MKTFSILTYNFVSIPFFSKSLRKRTFALIKEIEKIRPDIICFQELWWGGIRNKIIDGLKSLGYDFYFPKPGRLFNGLLTCSRRKIKGIKALNLKPTINGLNRLWIEFLGAKGYSLTEI